MSTPYRSIDVTHRRRATIAEAIRVRDALATTEIFCHIARGQIQTSQEIIDALTSCITELGSR